MVCVIIVIFYGKKLHTGGLYRYIPEALKRSQLFSGEIGTFLSKGIELSRLKKKSWGSKITDIVTSLVDKWQDLRAQSDSIFNTFSFFNIEPLRRSWDRELAYLFPLRRGNKTTSNLLHHSLINEFIKNIVSYRETNLYEGITKDLSSDVKLHIEQLVNNIYAFMKQDTIVNNFNNFWHYVGTYVADTVEKQKLSDMTYWFNTTSIIETVDRFSNKIPLNAAWELSNERLNTWIQLLRKMGEENWLKDMQLFLSEKDSSDKKIQLNYSNIGTYILHYTVKLYINYLTDMVSRLH